MRVSECKVYKTENLKKNFFAIASFILIIFAIFHALILRITLRIDQKNGVEQDNCM